MTATAPRVTPEQVAQYDRPGPRYTSYPTAIEFNGSFTPADYGRRLALADARAGEPLSVYTHIPFCAERCRFCACHVIASPLGTRVTEPYLAHLFREIELVASALPRRRRVAQYHWGGGTPTYLSVPEIHALLDQFERFFTFEPGAEIAIEVDPRVTTLEQLAALRSRGFNRLSLGVQDLDDQVQEAIGRVQPLAVTAATVDGARKLGFRGINIDLIYGLPHQTLASFSDTLDEVIALAPDRLAIYSFAFVPWLKGNQRKLETDILPDRDTKIALILEARERLLAAGYRAIGMDHFARPDDELAAALDAGRLQRNFMGYTVQEAADQIAFGVSAIGLVQGAYVQNHKKLSDYYADLEAGLFPVERGYALSADDRARADVIQSLMCGFTVDRAAIERRHRLDFPRYFAPELRQLRALAAEGLAEVDGAGIRVTPLGQLFVRNLAMCFDRYLPASQQASRPRFSRTI
ncbi:MAG TPA: oxygen-independent coproporphyrinogen III oxidase [Gemmatimonadales bacterium]|nr:oxygen-independent coproporphyrinogen III oxidase [Gemmatimonadales bacterium]